MVKRKTLLSALPGFRNNEKPHYLGAYPLRTTDEIWCTACKRHHASAHLVFLLQAEVLILSICRHCLPEATQALEPERCPKEDATFP